VSRRRAVQRIDWRTPGAYTIAMPLDIAWHFRPWSALTAAELHAMLQLRSRVFVVEQQCVFLEVDGRDPDAWHLLGTVREPLPEPGSPTPIHGAAGDGPSGAARALGDAHLAAYARVFAPGVRYPEAACIGRVVTHPSARGTGAGRAVMRQAIAACEAQWPGAPIGLEAQGHLERFYASLGFRTSGATYIEDGIPHVPMRREGTPTGARAGAPG
jgi:ElaA protein